MKLLFITPKIPFPPTDGHKKSMFGVIKYLSKLGYEIDIIAYQQNNEEKNAEGLREFAKVFLLDVQTPNSMYGAVKNLFSNVPYNLWKYQNPKLVEFLRKYFSNNKVDIIQVFNSHMGWIVDELRRVTKVPIILRQENLELSIMKKYSENQGNLFLKLYSYLQYSKFIKYEPELCSKFDNCVMISPIDQRKLLEYNPNIKTTVIPLGVEEGLFNYHQSENIPFTLFHIGSLGWYPNYDGINWFLKEIFPSIVRKYPDSKLYLYGGGFPDNYYFDERIKSNVVIKGFVEDIWSEVKDKHLAIVPLRIGSGIRVKIIELLAVGHNVISTSIGIEGLPLTDNENIIVADTKEEFLNKIDLFFSGKYNSQQIIKSAKHIMKNNFSWYKIAEQFDVLYKTIIKG